MTSATAMLMPLKLKTVSEDPSLSQFESVPGYYYIANSEVKMPHKQKIPQIGLRRKKWRPSEQPYRYPNVEHDYCLTGKLRLTAQFVDVGVQAGQSYETIDDDHNYSSMDTLPSDDEPDSDFGYQIEPPCPEYESDSEQVINNTDIAENVTIERDAFDKLFDDLLQGINQKFIVLKDNKIRVMEHYETTVKTCVVISKDFTVELFIHNKVVAASNSIFSDLGKGANRDIMTLLNRLVTSHVCIGNPEQEWLEHVPEGGYISSTNYPNLAYREGNFGARRGTFSYTSTIRAVDCDLVLTTKKDRCAGCSKVRAVLRNREYRRKESASSVNKPFLHSNYKHSDMDRTKLISKINEQKNEIKNLQSEVNKLNRQLTKKRKAEEQSLSDLETLERYDLLRLCGKKVKEAFPDENSFQRLFWQQQLRDSATKKKGIRWHPMIILWCMYLQHTSSKSYEALRDSGFMKLPSSRTLSKYSHCTRLENGVTAETVKLLQEEAEKTGMDTAEWKSWVGLLFSNSD